MNRANKVLDMPSTVIAHVFRGEKDKVYFFNGSPENIAYEPFQKNGQKPLGGNFMSTSANCPNWKVRASWTGSFVWKVACMKQVRNSM